MEYEVDFSMDSKKMCEIMNQLLVFGTDLEITCSEEKIQLGTNGISGNMMVNIPLNDLKELPELSGIVSKVFAEKKASEFLYQMKNWVEMLDRHHLTHLNSVHLRIQLEKCEDVFLAKPCGALGADVMVVFFHPEKTEVVKKRIFELGLVPQAHSYDLANGLSAQLRSLWSS
jgi:hypothetical protein